MRQLERIAGEADAGRLVKFFVRGGMGVSYHQFASLKVRGGLLVNGAPVHANYPLQPGDRVTVLIEDALREAVVPDPAPVVVPYEDQDIMIIEKSAPLACQCSPKQDGMTLENRLAWRCRDDPGFIFRPLNRLDRGTSGLMAAAKNAHAAQLLQKQLHGEGFTREYLAVAEGRLEGEGIIDAPIAKEEAASVRRVIDFERGKRAVDAGPAQRNIDDALFIIDFRHVNVSAIGLNLRPNAADNVIEHSSIYHFRLPTSQHFNQRNADYHLENSHETTAKQQEDNQKGI